MAVSEGMDVGQQLDPVSQEWIGGLRAPGDDRAAAERRLYDILVRSAHSEVLRRKSLNASDADHDELAGVAARDALKAVIADLDSFRGDSRFTTWASKFVMFAVSAAVGRRFWRNTQLADYENWEQLPARAGAEPEEHTDPTDDLGALRRAVDEELTVMQRAVFTAWLGDVPPEAMTSGLGSSRNAIYQALFEARRKIAARLATDDVHHPGHLPAANSAARWLDELLAADPGDTGCDLAFQALDRYAEADVLGEVPQRRYPGVAMHLASCAACRQDYEGMLAGGIS